MPARRRSWGGFVRFFTRGPFRWWSQRALEADLVRLAFTRWHLARDEEGWQADEDADVLALRERVRRRRRAMA